MDLTAAKETYKLFMTKEKDSKYTFKGVKEDGFWHMVFESLEAHPDEVVLDKVKSKAAVQEC